MNSPSARALWTTALGALQLEVTRHNFDTWLKDTTGLDFDGTRLSIGVPSSFVAECLEKRMTPLIQKTLKGIAQRDVEVSFVIHQAHASNQDLAPDAPLAPPEPRRTRAPARPRQTIGQLNHRYTFDTFIVGKSNRFAHAAAIAVADSPGTSFNPLVIHAGVGLGKTHLLHAIGHTAQAKGLHFLYVSAEQFTNDFVSALREGRLDDFRTKYRSLDLLLLDDIQFIAGKEHSRESFFHTFNDLHTASKQIVITTDTRPKAIPLLEERLSSRLEGGLRADIQPPDLETRTAILQNKAEAADVRLVPEVTDFIARRIVRNVRDLEGALNRILAMARLANRAIDLDLAQQAMSDLPTPPSPFRRATPTQLLEAVSTYYDLPLDDLTGKSRKKGIALARQIAAYLLREDTSRSLADIGNILGGRGHTTALRAHDKIAYLLNVDSDLRRQIGEIHDLLDRQQSQSA
ncbi:MAG: chromosomal replication initiator protein DnaA [Dehalococcoidia bacterium]